MKTRIVHAIAGTFIFASLLLAVFVNINWLWFTAFVGLNMWLHALTGWCMMYKLVGKLGFADNDDTCCTK